MQMNLSAVGAMRHLADLARAAANAGQWELYRDIEALAVAWLAEYDEWQREPAITAFDAWGLDIG